MSIAVEALCIGSPAAGLGHLIRGLMPTSLVGGPQPLHARQGREMQRYNQDGARLVAGYVATTGLPARALACQSMFQTVTFEHLSVPQRTAHTHRLHKKDKSRLCAVQVYPSQSLTRKWKSRSGCLHDY